MEFKGTKGEWIANYSNESETYISCNGLRIAQAKHYKNHILNDPSTEEGRANAKLISSALDLLKVCISLKEILYDISMPQKVMNDLEVAINKALK